MSARVPAALLSIAGSDPVAGAGVQADLRAFDHLGFYGFGVITAVTAQSTTGLQEVYPLEAAQVERQLQVLLADVRPLALKTGMLATADIVVAVVRALKTAQPGPLVVDPVLASTSGGSLGEQGLAAAIRELLLPLCRVVTPNLAEAAELAGGSVRTLDDARAAAARLVELGAPAACITGGHLDGDPADVLYDGDKMTIIRGRRAGGGREFHGTGCLFSAALAGFLAGGRGLTAAAEAAHGYVAAAIGAAVAPGGGMDIPWPPRLEPRVGNL